MTLLVDIILESRASDEAEAQGLVKKPGFGLYGPPNEPASHRSLFGKLIKLKGSVSDKRFSGFPDKLKGFFGKTGIKASTLHNRFFPKKQKFTNPLSKGNIAADKMTETLTSNGTIKNIQDTLSALTQVYGREKAPPITSPGTGMKKSQEHYGVAPMGVYNYVDDVIEVEESLLSSFDSPVSEWDHDTIHAFHVHIHETLHSASGRIHGTHETGYYFYNTGINIAIEEGLTEYLTQSILRKFLNPHREVSELSYSYPNEVDAIDMMVDHGGLDPDNAFRNTEKDDIVAWNIRHQIFTAQFNTVQNILTDAGMAQDNIDDIFELIRADWTNDVISLTNPEVRTTLEYIINKNYKVNTNDIYNLLTDSLY